MCDFHSVVGVVLAEDKFKILHLPSNSHAEMAGLAANKPHRQLAVFEAEWDATGKMPSTARLIRNAEYCPGKLVALITQHFEKVAAAVATGKYLQDYFRNLDKWHDVWTAAMRGGVAVDLSEMKVFPGTVYVREGAPLTAPQLTKAGGLYVHPGATLTAPQLTEVAGGVYVREGATLTAPQLTEVAGGVYVHEGATLTAPQLKSQEIGRAS